MVILGTLLGVTAEWWGVIFGVLGVIVSVTQAVRKRRKSVAERKQ